MTPILECRDLAKQYGTKAALQGVNLRIPRGRIYGLLGPNGSGKTTLIKIAAGLLRPTSGELLVDGKPVGVETKALVSYLPEQTYIPAWMRVKEILRYFVDFYPDFDPERAGSMLEDLGIDSRQAMRTMSKGTKEKVQLILVMSRRASLYLLDEPIGGVDPAARDYILRTIITNYDEQATVLLSTHLIADVEQVLDDVIFLRNGRIAEAGDAESIRMKTGKSIDALFREVFRC